MHCCLALSALEARAAARHLFFVGGGAVEGFKIGITA